MSSLADRYPYYLANEAHAPNADLEVTDKYTGEPATRVARADAAAVDRAIAAAVAAEEPMRRLPAWKRQRILMQVVEAIEARHEELAQVLRVEAGKPIKDARGEITRGVDTFRVAAEEAVRIHGELQPLDISERAEKYQAIWKRVPIGACSFISPWNFPINLVAHKVAPAIAMGCPFVLKPASATPVSALLLGEILAATDLPKGAFSIMPMGYDAADALVTDDRLKLLSFTGSPGAGWKMKARAGKKRVVLELGGNAACIVDRDADLDTVTKRLMVGAFYQSGQSCISTQRILIHRDIYAPLRDKLVEAARALVVGDPKDDRTFVGPLISEDDAERLVEWTEEARAAGAKVLCGGERDGVMFPPTLIEGAPRDCKVQCDEVFGPIACVDAFDDFEEACRVVDDSRYGLQAGVFSRDIHRVFHAWNTLHVGGVVINDVPSVRVDSMPYGGVKDSGLGREGIKFAMEDMSEIRLLMLNDIGLG
ncbi:MAG: aldehyde dehydrogenase family protein [bacterium]